MVAVTTGVHKWGPRGGQQLEAAECGPGSRSAAGGRAEHDGNYVPCGKAWDQEQLVAMALEYCGGVDFLGCVAGVILLVGSTLGSGEQVWDKVRSGEAGEALWFWSPQLGCMAQKLQLLLKGYISRHRLRNSIETLLSIYVIYFPFSSQKLGAYNVSETALLGLTKTLAQPTYLHLLPFFHPHGGLDFTASHRSPELMGKHHHSQHHLLFSCRVGWPEDCEGLVSFLCSPDASYITGEHIMVACYSPHL
ncbi:hypothetical protein HPG69_002188 [Diceros bicornis minor]|uniref:Uncharacterized protein n=1 Tax=Diceros bicornis minor TaxID=77932 RepID=A0A7J7FCW0_DICBM|nr:hypothetical protein HPG69_002188 [Diceros bicornis minor]